MELKLDNKLALVTGSTAGISFAIATGLTMEGARVIINGRTVRRVSKAIDSIKNVYHQAKLEPLHLDLSKAEFADETFNRFPSVDILINNLGIYAPKPFEQISDADWFSFIETNFMSGVRLSRYYLPKMLKANQGRIIFISSESGLNIPMEMIHYGVTKTMQIALAGGLARLTAGTSVTVNSVLAGPTRSEGVEKFVADVARQKNIAPDQVEKEFFKSMRPSSLLQRFETIDEVAAMVTYIASPVSSATNGAAIRVDGGVVQSIF